MTKIVTKLPVSAEKLQEFKESSLKKMIAEAAKKLEVDFAALCTEFNNRFNKNEWILMEKDVYYINDIVGIIPNLSNLDPYSIAEYNNYIYNADTLKFAGFQGNLPTLNEIKKCFNDNNYYFRDGNGGIAVKGNAYSYRGLTYIHTNKGYWYYYIYNNRYKNIADKHGNRTDGDAMLSLPIFRFNGVDSEKIPTARVILYWLEYDLVPKNFNSESSNKTFQKLKYLYSKYEDYISAYGEEIAFDESKIFADVMAGTEFEFLPKSEESFKTTEVEASEEFIKNLKGDLLNGDKVRANLDPYDENILVDPNRGHWDLWDYGEDGGDKEKAGEITLPEGLTARDPADDINHGIVAIDFGTKSTVVVYENDRLQILPLQVGSGEYSQGVKAENYENPTVIQFLNIDSFVSAYNARAGRPHTKWNDVTVSHTAFDNLTSSDSKHYYSFLTGLKHWCGSNDRLKLKDRSENTYDLPPFLELLENDVNPLEYYAYYLGLYINNMLQEKRLFLKYIMSFPVTYDKAIRERMRRAFAKGLKKSFPTALLSNEEAMKAFTVQDGASEPAAYAITALQEYNFDPEDDEENYYAVFDFGGGTTDFDFGVFRESELDRYDYSLIHFGENGDRTLGGENLLKLLAFEVFKANQDILLNPSKDDKNVGKIQFTKDADGREFSGSTILIKDSQEANLNMHNLMEKLRPIWEDPEGEVAQKILKSGVIEVDLFTDKGTHLTKFPLYIAFDEGKRKVDLQKILRDRIEQGIKNFFIAMREAFDQNNGDEDTNIKSLSEIEEISIFLAGNSSKSKMVKEIFNEYLGNVEEADIDEFPFEDGVIKFGYTLKDGFSIKEGKLYRNREGVVDPVCPIDEEHKKLLIKAVQKFGNDGGSKKICKAQELLETLDNKIPKFTIYPALGTEEARKIQAERGVEVNPEDLAAPTGKTGVAFGLINCRDSGNIQITHVTPDKNKTPFQYYIGRNKKKKFKTIIDKNTKLEKWYAFIDAGNNFDILYSDLPEAVSNKMDVQKAKRVNVTLDRFDPEATVFIRAVKSNVIEYQVAKNIDVLLTPQQNDGSEPIRIELD